MNLLESEEMNNFSKKTSLSYRPGYKKLSSVKPRNSAKNVSTDSAATLYCIVMHVLVNSVDPYVPSDLDLLCSPMP
jgi:hypothetical protein